MPTLLLSPAAAYAAEPAAPAGLRRFDIPAQPLSAAIEAYAAATGVEVLYDRPSGAEPDCAPLHGQMTPQAALAALLSGTGLQPRFSDPRNAVLTRSNVKDLAGPSAPAAGDDLPRLSLDVLRVAGAPVIPARALAGPSPARLYAEAVRSRLQEALDADPVLSQGDYQAVLALGFGPDAHAKGVRLKETSGDRERDRRIEAVAQSLVMQSPPPPGFPAAMTLRVRSRPPARGG